MDFLAKIAPMLIFAYNLKMKNFTKCLLGIVLTQFSPSILAAVESYQSIPAQELIIESTDQILLQLIGMIAAGTLAGIWREIKVDGLNNDKF